MAIWTVEIKELEKLYASIKGQLPDLEKELERLIKADDENMILLYSRRCLEVIITDLCECELKRPRKTEPLKGIIDKLHKEEKVPSNIITSMDHLNSLSAYGAHPKDFDPEQVKPVLNNLDIVIKWYLRYRDLQIMSNPEPIETKYEDKKQTVSPREKSIIVLPFENMSSDREQEYFSDGLTEEIITDLSHIHDLLVISRSSAMTFKKSNKKIKDIANEVSVKYVLEGSVRKAGNNLKIIAQLIDAENDTHLWAEKYNGTLDDVFDIQEKVARAISDTLRLKLTEPEERQIAKRPIPNVQAHDFYLRACDVMYRAFTSEGIDEAIGFLESGLRIMGNNPLLLATLASVYMHGVRVWVKEEADLAKAELYARKALNLDPDMAQAYVVLGWIRWLQGKPREYYKLLKKALLLDPNDVETITWAYWLFISAGRTSKALNMAKHMIEIDPVHPYRFFYSAVVHAYEGRFQQAVEELRSQTPASILEQPAWLAWLGPWLVYAGHVGEAIEALEPIENTTAWNIYVQWPRLLRFALKGEMDHVDEVASEKFRGRVNRDCYVSCFLSGIYAMLGDKKEAFYWLEAAVDHGFINYPYLSDYDPLLASLKNEPQFQKLMERVKLEWENFEE
jgi:TolB-like protein/cytochrome c-type biogenesis protein CcmH/NrfG